MVNWNVIKEDTNIFGGKYFLVECIAEIKDNQTGEIRMIDTQERLGEGDDYPGVFNWGENNYSCDCNRRIFFKRSKNELTDEDFAVECSDGKYSVNLLNKKTGERYYKEFEI